MKNSIEQHRTSLMLWQIMPTSRSCSLKSCSSKRNGTQGRIENISNITTPRIKKPLIHEFWDSDDIDSLPDAAFVIPLEKTRISIEETKPSKVSQIISVILYDLSVTATPKRNKLLAKSLDRVQFYIRLYKEKSGTKHKVIVELQRKSGDSLNFHQIACNIFQAIKCRENDKIRSFEKSSTVHQQKKESIKVSSRCYVKERKDAMTDTLSSTVRMIKDAHIDTNLLGFKSLFFLTDEDSAGIAVSFHVAGAILQGGSNDCEYLKSSIENYIGRSRKHEIDQENEEDLCEGFEAECYRSMHYYALAVLANSLNVWSSHRMNMSSVINSEKWLGDSGLLSALICELSAAELHLHNAYQIMRCLNTLFLESSTVRRRAIELGAPSLMVEMQQIGHCSHALLAKESDSAIAALVCALPRPCLVARHNSI